MTAIPQVDVLVFCGQGSLAANTSEKSTLALDDAESTSGTILLNACFHAFRVEISKFTLDEKRLIGITESHFHSPRSLLASPIFNNSVISGSSLFLSQTLRYLSVVESSPDFAESNAPFGGFLVNSSIGVAGFSSGILPAIVVGSSSNVTEFISRSVEVYRLVLWIGFRCQIYRATVLDTIGTDRYRDSPWSLVFLGLNKESAEQALTKFHADNTDSRCTLFVTAILDGSVTISGRPDILQSFAGTFEGSVHRTTVDTLYHAPIQQPVYVQILCDAEKQSINFPDFQDLLFPIRSSFSGMIISHTAIPDDSSSLLEAVLKMLLLQPVNWDLVTHGIISALPPASTVRLLNFGPGSGITRSMERVLPKDQVSCLDLSSRKASSRRAAQTSSVPIAIVGMAVNMPGAPDTSKLWEVLEKGINMCSEIPEDRFKVSDYNSPKSSRSMKAHTGNFIDNPDKFDNQFFHISPREAKSMDPQQRILLHAAYEALEDAGYVPDATPTFSPTTFGCYIGVATQDYVQNLRNDIDVYYSPGTLRAFLSGRISYAFKFSGPSIVIDTACSSSVVALYEAVRALSNHDINAALVGGVNIISSPDMYLGLDRAHFLSPTGQCKAFDASADGYSRSEGCGMFVVKRLDDAIAENDNILGVVRGAEINQSGLAHSITHPHAPTQVNLFNRLLERSGVLAERVNVVEAHGTGTQAGDKVELESIRCVLARRRTAANPLHITSVKANIGHLEAAAGAAGLAKLLLMIKHRSIPPQISLKTLNPSIAALESDHTVIDTVAAPWQPSHEGKSRVALLNSFGAAGSNTAVLLEEFLPPLSDRPETALPFLFGISAKSEAALGELRDRHVQWISDPDNVGIPISDIAYTMTARRQVFSHTISVVAENREQLLEKLRRAPVTTVQTSPSQIAFVFSGQGAQYLGMGSLLYQTSPLFKANVDKCHFILVSAGFAGIIPIITGHGCCLSKSDAFEAYQSATFALEIALAQLWISWGLTPAVVVGHSLGEYAAMVMANVLTLEGALTLIAHRARLMTQKCEPAATGMLAVNLPACQVEEICSTEQFSGINISCYNSPNDCVAGGPVCKLESLKRHLDAEVKCKSVILNVPFGYHSSAMRPLLDDLTAVAQRVSISSPTLPIISNVYGKVVMPGDATIFNRGYFARHCAEPVRFEHGIKALIALPQFSTVSTWLEIGPHPTTLPMLKSILPSDTPYALLASIRKQTAGWTSIMASLSQLYAQGVALQWREVFSHVPSVKCQSLPSYPFSGNSFWVPFVEEARTNAAHSLVAPGSNFTFLGSCCQRPSTNNGMTAIFETPIRSLAAFITGHQVAGFSLCPASVYIEQIFAAVHDTKSYLGAGTAGNPIVMRDVQFVKPLVYVDTVSLTVITTIQLRGGDGTFTVTSRHGSHEEVVHARGAYSTHSSSDLSLSLSRTLPVIDRRAAAVVRPKGRLQPEVFSRSSAYEVIFPRVVDYGKPYHTMQSLTVDTDGMEGYAIIKLPDDCHKGQFVIHPVFMDTLLHVAGFVANLQGGVNDAFICGGVGSVKVVPQLFDNNASYGIYCSLASLEKGSLLLAEAYAVRLGERKEVVGHIQDMEFRRIPLNSFKKALAFTSGVHPFSKPLSRVGVTPHVAVSDYSEVQDQVFNIVSEALSVAKTDLNLDVELESLGVDSLMSIEILSKLESAFPDAKFDHGTLKGCRNLVNAILEASKEVSNFSSSARLSFPETRPITPVSMPPSSAEDESIDFADNVRRILASVLETPLDAVGDDVDLESLGLDSLTSIEAISSLESEFALKLPYDFFERHHTPRAILSYISSQLKPASQLKPSSDSQLISGSENCSTSLKRILKTLRLDTVPILFQQPRLIDRTPLVMIHDGSGLVNYLHRLPPVERTIWGIHNPHFPTSEPWHDLQEMARAYAGYVMSVSSGPVILGGWSFGGIAAYETSLQLAKRGVLVRGIVLIDSPGPVNHTPLSSSLIDAVVELDTRNGTSDLGNLLKRQFQQNASMLGRYDPFTTGGTCPPLVMLRSSDGFKPPGVSDVPVWLADRTNPKCAVEEWDKVTKIPIKVIDIPGNHFQPFHASNIPKLTAAITEACSYIEQL